MYNNFKVDVEGRMQKEVYLNLRYLRGCKRKSRLIFSCWINQDVAVFIRKQPDNLQKERLKELKEKDLRQVKYLTLYLFCILREANFWYPYIPCYFTFAFYLDLFLYHQDASFCFPMKERNVYFH